MYSSARTSSVKLDATPSFLFSNLAANAACIAYAHAGTVHVLPTDAMADVSQRFPTFRLLEPAPTAPAAPAAPAAAPAAAAAPADAPPAAAAVRVTSAAFAALDAGHFLVVTTPLSFFVFSCTDFAADQAYAPRPRFARHLAECGAGVLGGRRAEDHFFRGAAGCALRNVLLVGTSWGDVLAWRVDGAVLTLAQVLAGGHGAAVSCIAADERCGKG